MIWSGILFIRLTAVPGVEKNFAGVGLILWGLHQADYPFLRPIPWFAPWGYVIALAITTLTAVSILLVYFKIVRQDLAQSNLRFDSLFEHSHDAILMLDPQTDRVLEANPQALRMLGYHRDEFLRQPVSRVHRPAIDESPFARVLSSPGGWVGPRRRRRRWWSAMLPASSPSPGTSASGSARNVRSGDSTKSSKIE
jgi:PAS domain-containing protein